MQGVKAVAQGNDDLKEAEDEHALSECEVSNLRCILNCAMCIQDRVTREKPP